MKGLQTGGFLDKLFGRKRQEQIEPEEEPAGVQPEAAPSAEDREVQEALEPAPAEAEPAPSQQIEDVKPSEDDLAEPEVALAGPPEASVDYIEDVAEAPRHEEPEEIPRLVEDIDEPEAPAATAATAAPAARAGWFQRLTSGLKRSSDQLSENLSGVFAKRRLNDETLDELEDILIQSDLGIETAMAITDRLRRERFNRDVTMAEIRAVLADEVSRVLDPVAEPLEIDPSHKPFVILMVGVNGSGKTTTIGKLAQKLSAEGRKVMLAAGDTFRAAAIEQLQIWGQRTNSPVVARPAGSDASGLAFDAVTRAKAEGADVLIIDTAGRLQNRDELMSELEKIIRVIRKVDDTAPHAVLLTLDATTGQNALNQVQIFGQRAGVTGLVMTKLDGTARGGILVAIAGKHQIPVHFIGVGEGVEDLQPFKADDFAAAIAGRD